MVPIPANPVEIFIPCVQVQVMGLLRTPDWVLMARVGVVWVFLVASPASHIPTRGESPAQRRNSCRRCLLRASGSFQNSHTGSRPCYELLYDYVLHLAHLKPLSSSLTGFVLLHPEKNKEKEPLERLRI